MIPDLDRNPDSFAKYLTTSPPATSAASMLTSAMSFTMTATCRKSAVSSCADEPRRTAGSAYDRTEPWLAVSVTTLTTSAPASPPASGSRCDPGRTPGGGRAAQAEHERRGAVRCSAHPEALLVAQDVIEQRRLAGAEEARQHRHRQPLLLRAACRQRLWVGGVIAAGFPRQACRELQSFLRSCGRTCSAGHVTWPLMTATTESAQCLFLTVRCPHSNVRHPIAT